MKISEDLYRQLSEWITDKAARTPEKGVEIYILLSGNRHGGAVMRRQPQKWAAFVEAELRRYYNFFSADITRKQVREMDRQATGSIAEAEKKNNTGRRPDHDSLPDGIKELYTRNLTILQKMRELHMQLRSVTFSKAVCPDSERYSFIVEIIKLDKKLRANWLAYDSYKADEDSPEHTQDSAAS